MHEAYRRETSCKLFGLIITLHHIQEVQKQEALSITVYTR